jgi:acido-empty-quinoprotein group A
VKIESHIKIRALTKIQTLLLLCALAAMPLALLGQGPLDPSLLTKPATDSWPTYHGDYTGKHYSTLKQINMSNVKDLTLAWVYRANTATQRAIIGGPANPAAAATGRGGAPARAFSIKAAPLMVNGVLYLSSPDNAFAVDARTGQEIWHYIWQARSAIGNRGVGMYGDWLYMETPDNNVVSLLAATGKERWNKPIAPDKATNFSTSAPVIIRNHVILGVGGDSGTSADWVESIDPETGDLQWKWNVTPRNGDPELQTWPSEEASLRGAGGPWQPPTYDPDLNLMYITTGNPTPSFNGLGREGADLYTCSLVAMNPDTGKIVWYYQISPHDTHDWDSTETPVLIDQPIDGKPRKLLAIAERNGFYYLFDRTNGKLITLKPLIESANGYKGLDAQGHMIENKDAEPSVGGTIASPDSDGATNYPAPSFDPDTNLFYVNETYSYSIYYLVPDSKDPTGYGRGAEYHSGLFSSVLRALDWKTGDVVWEHKYQEEVGFPGGAYPGMLSTAGGLLFTGDPSGNFVAREARTGKNLWHAALGSGVSNAPETYVLDGRQYVLIAAGDSLYAFYLQ